MRSVAVLAVSIVNAEIQKVSLYPENILLSASAVYRYYRDRRSVNYLKQDKAVLEVCVSKDEKVQFEFLCALISYVRISRCPFECLKFDTLSFVIKTGIFANAYDKLNPFFHQEFHKYRARANPLSNTKIGFRTLGKAVSNCFMNWSQNS